MSELQIALIGFGVVLVVAVWAYNRWQDRKHRRRAEAMLPSGAAGGPDVLMADREEPPVAVLREPTFSEPPAASLESAGEAAPAPPLPAEWADGRVDCLLRVEFVDAVPAAALWAAHAEWSRPLDKPVQWFGLDARSGRWRALLPNDVGSVSQFAAAMQLVDRAGAIGLASLTTFLDGMRGIAQRHAGLVEVPEAEVVLGRANELDAFCAGVDLQLALHVVPRQGSLSEMLGAKLGPVLEACGLRIAGERHVAVDATGTEVFALACRARKAFSPAQLGTAALTDLIFSLDVPRVADGAVGFERMLECAGRCAEALGGQLVDAQGKPLPAATRTAIRARIETIQAAMAAAGIPAGGARALRLFA